MSTVVVGMSGGVDSSVAAWLCKEAGHRVIGLFMKNWEEEEGPCPAAQDYEDVTAVCRLLGIPHYSVNFSQEYWDSVFSECLEAYKLGETPNPDILCNREIKFRVFLEQAKKLGADFLATGHYCRSEEGKLLRGLDPHKDQSYFLYTLQEAQLRQVFFPIGGMEKSAVRALARKIGLPTAEKKDSTGICFIGKRPFKEFLSGFIEKKRGAFETLEGEVVGEHDGVAFYTIGQRRGLGIGGAGEAWYVVGKEIARNVVLVAQGDDHPALYSVGLKMHEVSWVGERPVFPLRCTAKVRYRSEDVPCTVLSENEVRFDAPVKAVTPHQSIVFYDGEICLGGALITRGLPLQDLPALQRQDHLLPS